MAECRLRRLDDGRYEYSSKKGPAFTLTAAALVRRLVAPLPQPRLHLTSFHGVYAPHARLRLVVLRHSAEESLAVTSTPVVNEKKKQRRLDWATLHQRSFGTDVRRCPCGGRRSIRALYWSRKPAEARLVELGMVLRSRVLPPETAPPQLSLAV